jgi:hypothetical protein
VQFHCLCVRCVKVSGLEKRVKRVNDVCEHSEAQRLAAVRCVNVVRRGGTQIEPPFRQHVALL